MVPARMGDAQPRLYFVGFPVTLHRHKNSVPNVLGKGNATILALTFFYIKKIKINQLVLCSAPLDEKLGWEQPGAGVQDPAWSANQQHRGSAAC